MKTTYIQKARIPELDILKGIAIMLVVLGHALIPFVEDYHNNIIFQICYSFHMPLLIFISGYIDGFRQNYRGGVLKEAF